VNQLLQPRLNPSAEERGSAGGEEKAVQIQIEIEMERMVGSWVVLLLLLAGVRSGGGLRCQDEAGEEVDW
jgi:hypothetical protein